MVKFILILIVCVLLVSVLGGFFNIANILAFLSPFTFIGNFILGITNILGYLYNLIIANTFCSAILFFFVGVFILRMVMRLIFVER